MALLNKALVSWISEGTQCTSSQKNKTTTTKQATQAFSACLPQFLLCFQEPFSAPWGWDSGRQGVRATLLERGGKGALPQAMALESPIISSHQLAHALSDVDRLDLLGLEAEITGPNGRGLGGQQAVGTLGHAGALAVKPLLA